MTRTGPPVDLEAFDRLEEKVKLLVALVGRLRSDQARMAEEHARLTRELEAAQTRAREMDATTTQVAALMDERDQIRTRVSALLGQLENLSI